MQRRTTTWEGENYVATLGNFHEEEKIFSTSKNYEFQTADISLKTVANPSYQLHMTEINFNINFPWDFLNKTRSK